MKAILNGKLGEIVISVAEGVTIRFPDGSRKAVIYGTPGLVINPTEAQIKMLQDGSGTRQI